jgi:hypothetical protein
MRDKNLLQGYPIRRIKPFDGMAVTASVWREAHRYHDEQRRFHSLFSHGPGIVCGLEVVASEPPDSTVFIKPGIATDPLGRQIVVVEPVSFDVGQSAEGLLYLLLSYAEGDVQQQDDPGAAPAHIEAGFGIEVQTELPDAPFIELARIRRGGRTEAIHNAGRNDRPVFNEIDLRYRELAGASGRKRASAALCVVGGAHDDTRHAAGLGYLARAFNRSGLSEAEIQIDVSVRLDESLNAYQFLYLVAAGEFELKREEMESLYGYLQNRGTVLIESCYRDIQEGEPPADQSIARLLGDLGLELSNLAGDSELLVNPYVFGALPRGFEEGRAGEIRVGEGVIVSTFDYGCIWEGKRRGGDASREEIRSALEWGSNILVSALKSRQ